MYFSPTLQRLHTKHFNTLVSLKQCKANVLYREYNKQSILSTPIYRFLQKILNGHPTHLIFAQFLSLFIRNSTRAKNRQLYTSSFSYNFHLFLYETRPNPYFQQHKKAQRPKTVALLIINKIVISFNSVSKHKRNKRLSHWLHLTQILNIREII